MNSKNIGIILSGGKGSRFKSDIPKQYVELNGKEIVTYSIEAFQQSKLTDFFVMVVDHEEYKKKGIENEYGIKCIEGGKTRNESLYNAIKYIEKEISDCKNILIHEAARPLIRADIIDQYFKELEESDAVITAAHITDSLGKLGETVVDRSQYYLIQAPEAFRFNLLLKHFSPDSLITATVQQLPSNIRVKKYFDFKMNYKVTYPEDLYIVEQIMKSY